MSSNLQSRVIYGHESKIIGNVIYVREEDFQIPIGDESFGVPARKLNLIQKKIINGVQLSQLFSYDDFSLWWFIRSSIYPDFKKIVNFVTKFSKFVIHTNPSIIEVEDCTYLNIIQQICKKNNIPLNVSKKSQLQLQIKNNLIGMLQKYRYKKVSNKKIKNRQQFYIKNNNVPLHMENKIIFAVPTIYRRLIVNLKTGQSEKGEYIQQRIIDLIDDKKNIIGMDLDYTFKGETETLSERMKGEIHWFPLEILLLQNHDTCDKHKEFIQKYNNIISSTDFHNLFQYDGILLWENLVEIFKKMTYGPYLPYYLNLHESLIRRFKECKPRCFFLPYETGPYALALILTARKFGIKTVGVAHAVMDKNNPEYSHEEFVTKENPFGFPLPDMTLLFGDFSKRTLVNQGYPEEKFVVFGNPAFFDLVRIEEFLSKKQLCLKYQIKPNQKVILLGTQMLQEYYNTHGKYNYDSQIWSYLLHNFGNKEEYVLILKPHPHENIEIYEKILQESGVINAQIIQGDLYELIYISSVVISIFSTFMLDSIVLKKPVIRVEFENTDHTIPYDEYEVLISTDLTNLSKSIHEILQNEDIHSSLLKNRDIFVKDQFNIPENHPEQILHKLIQNL